MAEIDISRFSTHIDVETINRFIKFIIVDKNTGAWIWCGGITGRGYGAFWYRGKTVSAHRFSYELVNGKIQNNLFVCHKYELLGRHNVNPDHLFLGTATDNMSDATNKNRMPFGTNNTQVKLSENPAKDVRKPKSPDHRDITITRHQIKLMLKAFGYSPLSRIDTISQSVAVCFLVALRTGMRAGELCNLTWSNVHEKYCVLPKTKTVPRHVPLSKKAVKLIGKMRGFDKVSVFSVSSATRDALFRRARDNAGLEGFTFHDARHTAATWMASKPNIDVLTLCKIFGWKDTSQALTYYNPKAHDVSKMLD